ncbi:assimilatory nitrate reductase catalytic subunit [Halogranum amylolyticum]|uniref:Assimilatory nitrate reductase catalytic subunit n=1 Tax=Halogranum amylolyticum TaxID=660520 RepID=A0A1H8TQR3_9EURY|nr:assimilatory nitrate reductase NasA [Halogranum amylolyticum]SEO92954.1 assimilatory nitrate reductase catalytic subunit [Halogranum amylolyticum]
MRCAVGCGHVHRGADIGHGLDVVRGDAAHPVNRGLACGRGIRETADPEGEWLTRPLVRKDGDLVRATWEDALDRVADAVGGVSDPDDVAILGSGQQTNEAAYALGKLARGGVGTRNYDANTTLCMASAVTAYYDAFGSDAPPPTYDDVPEAQTHVVWGANPAVAHPVLFRWIADSASDDDSRLVVVDPVASETAEAAAHHVQLAPGGDFALARAVLARLVESGGVDDEFVDANTDGFATLRESLPSVEAAAEEAGVDVETVDLLATAFDDQTLVYWGMGVNQSVRGTATSRALVDCCLASGNMGPGSGPFSLTGQANSMGTRVCSSKGSWPGHRTFTDPDHRRRVAERWGVPVSDLPDDAGPGPVGIVDSDPSVVWTVATNPLAGLPDAAAAREAFEDAFLVVQDAFRTETVELADVVLPAATWGESDGTAMNMERTVSRIRPATGLPSGVRTDLDIVAGVGARVAPELFPAPTLDPEAVFDEFAALTAGTDADCSGIGYDRLDEELAVRWPAPDAESSGGYRYYDPETETWQFPTPTGRAQFSDYRSEETLDLPEATSDDYPLTLTTAREADGYNTGVRSRGVDDPGPVPARVNPETVETYSDQLTDDRTVLESPRASVPAAVEADDAVPAGMVWLPIHHPMTNHLTVDAVDPESDEPNYKQCAVRLVAPDPEGGTETRDDTPAPTGDPLAPEVRR